MLRNNRGQILTIIEILVVVAIIVGVGLMLMRGYVGRSNPEGTTVATPQGRARGVDCANNLQQIRYAVTMAQQANEQSPASLADLASSGISPRMMKCPETDTPYSYDPSQGRVWCTTPGHERY